MSKNTKDERYISKLVRRMSAATRALIEPYLEQRRNEGLATRSAYTYALAISEVDRRLRGRPGASGNADDLRAFVSTGQDYKHTSRFRTSMFTPASLKWALRVKDLPTDLDKASYIRLPPNATHRNSTPAPRRTGAPRRLRITRRVASVHSPQSSEPDPAGRHPPHSASR